MDFCCSGSEDVVVHKTRRDLHRMARSMAVYCWGCKTGSSGIGQVRTRKGLLGWKPALKRTDNGHEIRHSLPLGMSASLALSPVYGKEVRSHNAHVDFHPSMCPNP